ncbi:RNA polymerase sigma-70 factor (ECF subfamily) [Novosphingobium sp. PhB57]|nr:RNA polymerase sigma-70 factor (ECF subfamily) [Novosphingobium sp. PhB57]
MRDVSEKSFIRHRLHEEDSANQLDDGSSLLANADWHAVRHAIVAYVLRKGQPRDVAEDVAQESLYKLVAYTRQGRPASLYGLALKIAGNSLIDRVRGETRFGAPVDETYACEAPLPDKVAEDRQQLERLNAALEGIPSLRRAVLMRRRVENQSHARIAAELGLSIAAVEKHIVRGLGDLRKAMADRVARGKGKS